MEGKKPTNASSTFDELFGRKEAAPSPAAGKSSSSAGYFSSVFPPASAVMGKDSSQSDLYRTLDKQRTEGMAADGKYQGSPSKNQSACKDGKPILSTEAIESPYFGSSVHYGGRDFYTSSSSHTSETPNSDKNREEDFSNSDAATRGDWWQGSLYY